MINLIYQNLENPGRILKEKKKKGAATCGKKVKVRRPKLAWFTGPLN
jgi:hypothetical protein